MDNPFIIIIALVTAGIVLIASAQLISRKRWRKTDEETLREFPYQAQNHFLSPAELRFFQTLRHAAGNHVVVCCKVGLGDVFWVRLEDKSKFRAYRNKIDRKHVDFLLCDATTMRPLVGVELDDKSHQRSDRQKRDAFVDQVYKAAGLACAC